MTEREYHSSTITVLHLGPEFLSTLSTNEGSFIIIFYTMLRLVLCTHHVSYALRSDQTSYMAVKRAKPLNLPLSSTTCSHKESTKLIMTWPFPLCHTMIKTEKRNQRLVKSLKTRWPPRSSFLRQMLPMSEDWKRCIKQGSETVRLTYRYWGQASLRDTHSQGPIIRNWFQLNTHWLISLSNCVPFGFVKSDLLIRLVLLHQWFNAVMIKMM